MEQGQEIGAAQLPCSAAVAQHVAASTVAALQHHAARDRHDSTSRPSSVHEKQLTPSGTSPRTRPPTSTCSPTFTRRVGTLHDAAAAVVVRRPGRSRASSAEDGATTAPDTGGSCRPSQPATSRWRVPLSVGRQHLPILRLRRTGNIRRRNLGHHRVRRPTAVPRIRTAAHPAMTTAPLSSAAERLPDLIPGQSPQSVTHLPEPTCPP